AATLSRWRASMGGAPRGEGHERGDTPVGVIVATAGGAPWRCRAPRRVAPPLLAVAVGRAPAPPAGHGPPPPPHEQTPPVGGSPLATGRLLQVSEPSMDGGRHCGSPSPLSGPHGGGPLPDLPGTRLLWSGPRGSPPAWPTGAGGAMRPPPPLLHLAQPPL